MVSKATGDKFIRNTLRNNGASVGYRAGFRSEVRLNDISGQCWGVIQHDGAGIQVMTRRQTNTMQEQNWVYNTPKYGIRFDGSPGRSGVMGIMKGNVLRNTNGMMVKGDHHTIEYNLVFDKYTKEGDDDGQAEKCNLCVLRSVKISTVGNGTAPNSFYFDIDLNTTFFYTAFNCI